MIGGLYAEELPQDPILPAGVFSLVSTDRPLPMAGSSTFASQRYRVNIYAYRESEMQQATTDLRQLLHGYAGTVLGVEIGSINCVNEFSGLDEGPDLRRRALDFLVLFKES